MLRLRLSSAGVRGVIKLGLGAVLVILEVVLPPMLLLLLLLAVVVGLEGVGASANTEVEDVRGLLGRG